MWVLVGLLWAFVYLSPANVSNEPRRVQRVVGLLIG